MTPLTPRLKPDGPTLAGHGSPKRATHHAFTLIEMVGVLAVIAILAIAVISTVIRRVDMAASVKEKADLDTMADSFVQTVLRNKRIPAVGEISSTIANDMALPLTAVTANSRGYARAFLVDRNFRVNNTPLPYTNSVTGATNLVGARIMIVSSLQRTLPITSGDGLSDGDFQVIWDTAEGSKPASGTWNAFSGDDLHIKKLSLEPLFHRLMLVNRDGGVEPRFSIDTTNSAVIAYGPAGRDAYYMKSSVVGLHDPADVPVTKYLLDRDMSFVFERGKWQGWIGPGDPYYTISDTFVREAVEFLGAEWNGEANGGASQTGVLVAMYVFMFDYALWAEECPHFAQHGIGNVQVVPEYLVLDALGKTAGGGILDDASRNLLDLDP